MLSSTLKDSTFLYVFLLQLSGTYGTPVYQHLTTQNTGLHLTELNHVYSNQDDYGIIQVELFRLEGTPEGLLPKLPLKAGSTLRSNQVSQGIDSLSRS